MAQNYAVNANGANEIKSHTWITTNSIITGIPFIISQKIFFTIVNLKLKKKKTKQKQLLRMKTPQKYYGAYTTTPKKGMMARLMNGELLSSGIDITHLYITQQVCEFLM